MKKAFLLMLLFTDSSIFAQTKQDSLEISRIVIENSTAFYKNDLETFAKAWDKNAVFITVVGLMAEGKENIVAMHKNMFKIAPATEVKLKQPRIKFINPSIAIVYSVWDGLVFAEGPAKDIVQSGYLTFVMQCKNKIWMIISATNAYNISGRKDFDLMLYNRND